MENVSGQVVTQPSSTVVISLPTDLLNSTLDGYWSEVKDRLHPDLVKKATKGGFREIKRDRVVKAAGGPSIFYRQVLLKAVSDYLKTQPRQALAYGEITLMPSVGPASNIQATVFLEPQVSWKKVPGEEGGPALEVKIPKLDDALLDKIVDSEIERGRASHAVLVPIETPAADTNIVLIDCNTIIDGQPWAPGSFKSNKWLLDASTIKIRELYDNLLGMNKDESKTFKITFNDKFEAELQGKEAEVTLKLLQTYRQDQPTIDDDLAISAGYVSLLDWRTQVRNRYDEILKNEKQNKIAQTLLTMFVNPEVIDIEPLPNNWLFAKAREIYNQQRSMVKTEEELLAKYKGTQMFDGSELSTKEDLMTLFASRAAQMLVEDLVFRSYGQKMGVEGDTSLDNVAQYATAVRKILLEKVKVIEVDPNATV